VEVKTEDKITDLVIVGSLAVATKAIEEIPEGGDLRPVFIGMAFAYVALAVNTGGKELARELLGFAMDRLDDPKLFQMLKDYNRQRGQP
jgi:hypothetical protein